MDATAFGKSQRSAHTFTYVPPGLRAHPRRSPLPHFLLLPSLRRFHSLCSLFKSSNEIAIHSFPYLRVSSSRPPELCGHAHAVHGGGTPGSRSVLGTWALCAGVRGRGVPINRHARHTQAFPRPVSSTSNDPVRTAGPEPAPSPYKKVPPSQFS